VSFHLGDTISTIDLDTESLEPAQLVLIEELANRIVAEARPMAHRSVSAEDAERLLAAGIVRKLPPRAGDFRLVVIAGEAATGAITGKAAAGAIAEEIAPVADLDVNACGGTHVTSTSQIGAVLLRGTERIRQSVRVSFLCGDRAIAAARADDALLSQLGREFSVGRADLPAALARMKAESKSSAKERQTLREDLANYHAARLIVEDPPQDDLRIVRRIFLDRDAEYIKLLASRVARAAPHTIALLASTQQPQAAVVVACGQEPGRDAGGMLRTALAAFSGRGGGSATLAQGLVPTDQVGPVLDALEAQLRSRPVPAG
jgi:alanyl-tRNA synthetase